MLLRGIVKIRGPTITNIMQVRASKIKLFDIMLSQLAEFSLRYSIEGILKLDDRVAMLIVEDAIIKVNFLY
jgi:hypothetical protein